jgi:hypothetical protein
MRVRHCEIFNVEHHGPKTFTVELYNKEGREATVLKIQNRPDGGVNIKLDSEYIGHGKVAIRYSNAQPSADDDDDDNEDDDDDDSDEDNEANQQVGSNDDTNAVDSDMILVKSDDFDSRFQLVATCLQQMAAAADLLIPEHDLSSFDRFKFNNLLLEMQGLLLTSKNPFNDNDHNM